MEGKKHDPVYKLFSAFWLESKLKARYIHKYRDVVNSNRNRCFSEFLRAISENVKLNFESKSHEKSIGEFLRNPKTEEI